MIYVNRMPVLDVLTIGDATLDLILDVDRASVHCRRPTACELSLRFGAKIPVTQAHQALGGNAANVCVGLSYLGNSAALYSEVGTDAAGETIRAELELSGINTDYLAHRPDITTRYSVVLTHAAERTILTYHPAHPYQIPTLPPARLVYYTSLGPGFARVQTALAKYLKKNPDTIVASNPGSHQLTTGLKEYKKILPHVDYLFVNAEEAKLLTGSGSLRTAAKRLQNLGPHTVIITNADQGAVAASHHHFYTIGPSAAKPVSKTGAGDAFASGFLGAILVSEDVPTALQWGALNSAAVISQFGAQTGLLSIKEIRRRLKKAPSVRS